MGGVKIEVPRGRVWEWPLPLPTGGGGCAP